jgi:hypothetical protein
MWFDIGSTPSSHSSGRIIGGKIILARCSTFIQCCRRQGLNMAGRQRRQCRPFRYEYLSNHVCGVIKSGVFQGGVNDPNHTLSYLVAFVPATRLHLHCPVIFPIPVQVMKQEICGILQYSVVIFLQPERTFGPVRGYRPQVVRKEGPELDKGKKQIR